MYDFPQKKNFFNVSWHLGHYSWPPKNRSVRKTELTKKPVGPLKKSERKTIFHITTSILGLMGQLTSLSMIFAHKYLRFIFIYISDFNTYSSLEYINIDYWTRINFQKTLLFEATPLQRIKTLIAARRPKLHYFRRLAICACALSTHSKQRLPWGRLS